MSADIVEPVGWLYPDGTYTPHRENLEQWGWSPVYAAATIERLTRERDEAKGYGEGADAICDVLERKLQEERTRATALAAEVERLTGLLNTAVSRACSHCNSTVAPIRAALEGKDG